MSGQYRAGQYVTISGWDCGTEIELRMIVAFKVHPGCKQTLTEPGEEPSVEVDDVQFFDGNDAIKLPWSIEDRFASADGFKAWLMGEASEQHEAALSDAADAKRERDLDNDLPF
jgi:hypothetical protein